MKFLRESYNTRLQEVRDWYRGYHCFASLDDVKRRFDNGQPLSCFVIDEDTTCVHIAYRNRNTDSSTVTYASFRSSTILHKKEAGVHFCQFMCTEEETTATKEDLKITDYALMLPYMKRRADVRFQKMFTLIYSDWEVLRCDLNNRKGTASTCNQLFEKVVRNNDLE